MSNTNLNPGSNQLEPEQPSISEPPQGTRTVQTSLFRSAPLTFGIIGITVLVYILQMASLSLFGVDYPQELFLKYNELILQGELWRLITPILIHASILHIGMNMYALLILGPVVERTYGKLRFLELYLMAGLLGNTFSFFFTQEPSLGASTAIFGLISAQAVYIYRNRVYYGKQARPMLMNILFIILLNVLIGFIPGIDYWGHLGGLLGGLIFAWGAGPVFESVESPYGYSLAERNRTSPHTIFLAETILVAVLVLIKFIHG